MTFTVVLDVNVLASAAVTKEGHPGIIVDDAVDGIYRLVLSDHILWKLNDVLRRPYFAHRLEFDSRIRFLTKLNAAASLEQPDPAVSGVCDDEEDDLVLGTTVAAGADYLVTGDKGLLRIGAYQGVRIVGAAEFLDLIHPGVTPES